MTTTGEHVDFATLNDYADGRLAESEVVAIERHLESCQPCSGQHRDLIAMLRDVAALPRAVLPEADIWPDLRRSLESRKDLVLPTGGTLPSSHGSPTPGGIAWRSRAKLAVAAVLLVIASSAITTLVLRSGDRSTYLAQDRLSADPKDILGAQAMLPASFRITEDEYARTIGELRVAFDVQRGQLSPETVRTVERSLNVIDAAIKEARDALLADPGNRTLLDLLSASYQRKLDLLRRTSELSSRT